MTCWAWLHVTWAPYTPVSYPSAMSPSLQFLYTLKGGFLLDTKGYGPEALIQFAGQVCGKVPKLLWFPHCNSCTLRGDRMDCMQVDHMQADFTAISTLPERIIQPSTTTSPVHPQPQPPQPSPTRHCDWTPQKTTPSNFHVPSRVNPASSSPEQVHCLVNGRKSQALQFLHPWRCYLLSRHPFPLTDRRNSSS